MILFFTDRRAAARTGVVQVAREQDVMAACIEDTVAKQAPLEPFADPPLEAPKAQLVVIRAHRYYAMVVIAAYQTPRHSFARSVVSGRVGDGSGRCGRGVWGLLRRCPAAGADMPLGPPCVPNLQAAAVRGRFSSLPFLSQITVAQRPSAASFMPCTQCNARFRRDARGGVRPHPFLCAGVVSGDGNLRVAHNILAPVWGVLLNGVTTDHNAPHPSTRRRP